MGRNGSVTTLRTLSKGIGAASLVSLAGCSSDSGSGGNGCGEVDPYRRRRYGGPGRQHTNPIVFTPDTANIAYSSLALGVFDLAVFPGLQKQRGDVTVK